VPAGEHHCVLGRREADDALTLGLVCDVSRRIVDTVDVAQVEDRIVILDYQS
jgi:hypothetical protein